MRKLYNFFIEDGLFSKDTKIYTDQVQSSSRFKMNEYQILSNTYTIRQNNCKLKICSKNSLKLKVGSNFGKKINFLKLLTELTINLNMTCKI